MATTVSPWWGYGGILLATVLFGAIRVPFMRRSAAAAVRERRSGLLDRAALWLVVGPATFFLPLLAAAGLLRFADQRLAAWRLPLGAAVLAAAAVVFYRSHADLGTNWSVTLAVREEHQLVTSGIYARVRHPMYSSLVLLSLCQLCFVPNWVGGLAGPIGMALFLPLRIALEERMMVDTFGGAYRDYARRTNRLWPPLLRKMTAPARGPNEGPPAGAR